MTSRSLLKKISTIPDWKTRRRIVVIESDDWGSLRMPSMDAFKKLEEAGLDLHWDDAGRFNLNDNLATSEDLERLFEVLSSVKDSRGNPAVFTPVSIVANPDFQKIRESGYKEYFLEPFTETLKRFPGCEKAFERWKEGIEKGLFIPQMHGREHLNVIDWMQALQEGEDQTRTAFEQGVWGFKPSFRANLSFQAAFSRAEPQDLDFYRQVIAEGLQLFEELFSYKAVFFVPPNGVLNNSLNRTLAGHGIKYRSGSRVQMEPAANNKLRRKLHYLGQKDRHGIRYIIRNCFFEPNQAGTNWKARCLYEMDAAFREKKPAIIGSHRVNFIGALSQKNREDGLLQLSELLKETVKRWPDVEFMTSAQLGALMDGEDI